MSISKQFMKGLSNYKISIKEINDNNWKYCGGNQGSHLNYFKISRKNTNLPPHIDKCICGHHIEENCYITNGDRIIASKDLFQKVLEHALSARSLIKIV